MSRKKKIVVIGSGLAGSLLSNALAQRFKVELLEKGAECVISYPEIEFSKKKFSGVKTVCHGGGGTTNLWHNGLMPINCDDITDSGFRAILSEATPYLDRAATNLYFLGDSYAAEYRELKEELRTLVPFLAESGHGIDCLLYPKKFRRLSVAPEVNVRYSVEKITFTGDERCIDSVRYFARGEWHQLECDLVILSAGALGTPVLVRDVSKTLGVTDARIGSGLIDHPMGFVGKIKIKKELAPAIRTFSAYDKGDYISRNALLLKSRCGNYSACAYFRPALTMQNRLSLYKYKSLLGASRGVERLRNMFSFKLFHPDIVAEIIDHLLGVRLPGRIFNVLFVAEQKRGRYSVAETGGKLRVDWDISDVELAIYREMLKDLEKRVSAYADEVKIETDISPEWLWSMAHHSGTIPLGEADGLIDGNLKLNFCKNVYVCDGSVVQEHSYANTGLAIGQLALRLADRISHEY